MQKVGFLGLGLMGGPMAANVARAGYPLTVYNRSAEKAAPLAALGAQIASSPAEVARHSDVIVTMLSDAAALEGVLFGAEGILSAGRDEMVLIDSSTIAPDQTRAIAARIAPHGLKMLDAPVFGSVGPATEGSLTFIVGGEREVFDAQYELLDTMGKHMFYMGPQGSGATVKLSFNLIVAAQVASLAEAMALAAKGGLDLAQFAEVIKTSAVNSKLVEWKARNMINGTYQAAFPLKHMQKDLGLMARTAGNLAVSLPGMSVHHALYTAAVARGHGEEDFSAIFTLVAEMAGLNESREAAVDPV